MRKVEFLDTSLRDGEQTPGVNFSIKEKIAIAKQLEKWGISAIEAGFPAASPDSFEAVKQIAEAMTTTSVTGLARSVKSDIDACYEALKYAKYPQIHVFIATSPIHREFKLKKSKDELDDTNKMDTYKLYGDILMINAHLQVQYEPSIQLQNLLSEEGELLTIPLKPNLTIVENGQWYYKLYTKLKNRMVSGEYQLNASTTKLEYLKSILYSISLATTRESLEEIRKECMDVGIIKKSKKPLSYKLGKSNYIHLTINEGEIFIGRNNQQNEYLTHRFAKPTDIWFHTQDIQGSHLILRLNVEPDDMILSKVAQYAAYFSKARETSKVPVDYTYIKNIKKPPGSPLGFVIFKTHQTMIVEPKKPDNYNE